MSSTTSTRSSVAPRVIRYITYAGAGLAGAIIATTLVLIAIDGHPVGLLTVPAGAVVPVLVWAAWRTWNFLSCWHSTRKTRWSLSAALARFDRRRRLTSLAMKWDVGYVFRGKMLGTEAKQSRAVMAQVVTTYRSEFQRVAQLASAALSDNPAASAAVKLEIARLLALSPSAGLEAARESTMVLRNELRFFALRYGLIESGLRAATEDADRLIRLWARIGEPTDAIVDAREFAGTVATELQGINRRIAITAQIEAFTKLSREIYSGLNKDLRGADLRGADLREADLVDADLREALWSSSTSWPAPIEAEIRRRSTPIESGLYRIDDTWLTFQIKRFRTAGSGMTIVEAMIAGSSAAAVRSTQYSGMPANVEELRAALTSLVEQLRASPAEVADPESLAEVAVLAQREARKSEPNKIILSGLLQAIMAGVTGSASLASAVVAIKDAVTVLL